MGMLRSPPGWWHAAGLPAVGVVIVVTALVAVSVGSPESTVPVSDGPPTAIAGGYFEASGVAHIAGTHQLLFLDDDRPRDLFILRLSRDGRQEGLAESISLGAEVTDLEGITTDGPRFYVVGSQSKPTGFDGDGLVRFTYDTLKRQTGSVERIQGLKSWLAGHVPELRGVDLRQGDDVLNVEGLAWDPSGQRLLLGLRAPVVDGYALIVPVRLVDPEAAFARENLRSAGPTIRLALRGAGIRSIEFDDETRSFVIITGASLNEEDREFRVVEWSGDTASRPRDIAIYDRRIKPEGLTRAVFDGRSVRVIVFDTGRFVLTE